MIVSVALADATTGRCLLICVCFRGAAVGAKEFYGVFCATWRWCVSKVRRHPLTGAFLWPLRTSLSYPSSASDATQCVGNARHRQTRAAWVSQCCGVHLFCREEYRVASSCRPSAPKAMAPPCATRRALHGSGGGATAHTTRSQHDCCCSPCSNPSKPLCHTYMLAALPMLPTTGHGLHILPALLQPGPPRTVLLLWRSQLATPYILYTRPFTCNRFSAPESTLHGEASTHLRTNTLGIPCLSVHLAPLLAYPLTQSATGA